MSEVSCRAWSYFQVAAERGLIDLDDLLEDSRLTRQQLERSTGRVPWDDWALMCDRFTELVGAEVAERTALEFTLEGQLAGPLKSVAMATASPNATLMTVLRMVGPMLYRALDWEITELPDGRVQVDIHVQDGFRGSHGWFLMAEAAIPQVPMVFGSSPAVCAGGFGPRGGTLLLTLPPNRSLRSLFRRWITAWRGANAMVEELDFQQRALLQTERSLAKSESRLRSVIDAFPDTLLTLDADLVVVDLHVGEQSLLSAEATLEFLGRPLFEVLPPEPPGSTGYEQGRRRLLRALESRSPEQYEYCVPAPAGEVVVDVRLLPYLDDMLLVLVRDLSTQRALERQVAVAERMASMGQLAAGVAHEINNPLTYVGGNLEHLLELLPSAVPDPANRKLIQELLEECRDGTLRVGAIVRELNHFSRVDALELGPVDIEEVVRTAVSMAALDTRHRTALEQRLEGPFPLLEGDTTRLVQILVNLLVNAAQATEGETNAQVELRVRHDAESACLRLQVVDNGPGIPNDVLPRVFDPFFTTKPPGEGTGLGLSVSLTAVQSMGGTLTARNSPAGGALFELTLPVLEEASTQAPKPAPEEAQGLRILVVDDEISVGRAIGRLLRGNLVRVVQSVHDARVELAGGFEPDVVLCDLMMPVVTGMGWWSSLEDQDPLRLRMLFMTGGAVTAEAQRFLDEPGVRHLSKPFNPQELRSGVARVARLGLVATPR